MDVYSFLAVGYQGEFIDYDSSKKDIHSISLGYKSDLIFGHNIGMFYSIDFTISPFIPPSIHGVDFKYQLQVSGVFDLGLLYRVPVTSNMSFLFGVGGFVSGGGEIGLNGFGTKKFDSYPTSHFELIEEIFEKGIISTFNAGVSVKVDMNYQISEKTYLKFGFTGRFILYRLEQVKVDTNDIYYDGDTKIFNVSDCTVFVINPYFGIGFKW